MRAREGGQGADRRGGGGALDELEQELLVVRVHVPAAAALAARRLGLDPLARVEEAGQPLEVRRLRVARDGLGVLGEVLAERLLALALELHPRRDLGPQHNEQRVAQSLAHAAVRLCARGVRVDHIINLELGLLGEPPLAALVRRLELGHGRGLVGRVVHLRTQIGPRRGGHDGGVHLDQLGLDGKTHGVRLGDWEFLVVVHDGGGVELGRRAGRIQLRLLDRLDRGHRGRTLGHGLRRDHFFRHTAAQPSVPLSPRHSGSRADPCISPPASRAS